MRAKRCDANQRTRRNDRRGLLLLMEKEKIRSDEKDRAGIASIPLRHARHNGLLIILRTSGVLGKPLGQRWMRRCPSPRRPRHLRSPSIAAFPGGIFPPFNALSVPRVGRMQITRVDEREVRAWTFSSGHLLSRESAAGSQSAAAAAGVAAEMSARQRRIGGCFFPLSAHV